MANALLDETAGNAHEDSQPLKQWINQNNLPSVIYSALLELDVGLNTLLLSEKGTHKQLPTVSQICNDLQETLGDEVFNMTVQLQFIESLQNLKHHENNEPQSVKKHYKISVEEKSLLKQLNTKYNLYSMELKSIPLSLQWLKQEQVKTHDIINQMFIRLQNKLNEKQELFDEYTTNIYHDFEQSLVKKHQQKLDQISQVKDQCNKLWSENIQSKTATILMENTLRNTNEKEDETKGNDDPFADYKVRQQIIQTDMINCMETILKFDYNKNLNSINLFHPPEKPVEHVQNVESLETIQLNKMTTYLQSMGYSKEYIARAIKIHKKSKHGTNYTLLVLLEIIQQLQDKDNENVNNYFPIDEKEILLPIPPPPPSIPQSNTDIIFAPPPPPSIVPPVKKKKKYKKRHRPKRAKSDLSHFSKSDFVQLISKVNTDVLFEEKESLDSVPFYIQKQQSLFECTTSPLFNALEKDPNLLRIVFGYIHDSYGSIQHEIGGLIVSFVGTLSKIDKYGFKLKTGHHFFDQTQIKTEAEFLTKWTKLLYPLGKMTIIMGINDDENDSSRTSRTPIYQYKSEIIHWNKVKKTNLSKIKHLIRKEGLPHEYRGTIWQNVCGSREIRQIEAARYGSESLYNDLTQKGKNKYNRKIWMDICSTYTYNIGEYKHIFNTNINLTNISKYATPRQHALYRILKAFSIFRSDIGYEYGMHNVVGLLLMNMTEHEAFWVLVALTDSGFHAEYKMDAIWKSRKNRHLKNENGLLLELRLYKVQRLIQKLLPKIYKKIWIQYKIDYDFSECFHTIFLSTNLNVNYQIILRIWDVYINEGEKTIYRIIIGYLKYYKKFLLQCKSQKEIIKILDTGFNNIPLKHIDHYFKICFSEKITHAHLAQFEVEFNKINNKKM